MPRRSLWVFAAFFLSGASGLIYQVLWVRQFGNVFGNTTFSAALVTAVFLCGLGVGGLLFGRLADRWFGTDPVSPLRWYGWLELAIGGLGILLAYLLPLMTNLSAASSSYTRAADGFFELSLASTLLRYGWAILVIAPPTLLMGGTLTLLIRFLVAREVDQAGWRVALLYGVNTLGAAVGAFCCDFFLVPAVGVLASQVVAAALNLSVGLGALALSIGAARRGVCPGAAAAPGAMPPAGLAAEGAASPRAIALALFLAGFASMGLEIVWFRLLSSALGEFRAVFSLLLTVILIGIWLGSFLGGWLQRRFGRPALWYLLAQTLLIVSTLLVFAVVDAGFIAGFVRGLQGPYRQASELGRVWIEAWSNLGVILTFVGVPALCMGFGYPLANALCQQASPGVGSRSGMLYLATTLGNVVGALAAGFLLLPALGSQTSVSLCALFAFAAIVAVVVGSRRGEGAGVAPAIRRGFLACLLACCLSFSVFALLPGDTLLSLGSALDFVAPGSRVLATHEGIDETLVITEGAGGVRELHTNGHGMSATDLGSQRYMRGFVHFALLQMKEPARVLVICFGVGNTASTALLYPSVERLEVVDLSRDILGHAGYFAAQNHGVLQDPRTSVFINDGRHHLLMAEDDSYDLITLEPPPISQAGVSALYSQEFYRLVRQKLKPGGFFSQWFPLLKTDEPAARSLVRAFLEVFPNAVMLNGYLRQMILLGRKADGNALELAQVEANRESLARVRKDLERLSLESFTELVGSFAGSAKTLGQAVRGAAPLTDDRPVTEYSVHSHLLRPTLSGDLFDTSGASDWCPRCFADPTWAGRMPDLPTYLKLMQQVYTSPRFLRAPTGQGPLLQEDSVRALLEQYPVLKIAVQSMLLAQ